MIRSVFSSGTLPFQTDLSFDELKEKINKEEGLLWVILSSPTNNELLEILHDIFRGETLRCIDMLKEVMSFLAAFSGPETYRNLQDPKLKEILHPDRFLT